jgi:hypothetical protein
MEMRQRLAIATASVLAMMALTVGLVLAGFAPVPPGANGDPATEIAAAADAVAPQAVEPQVVYIKPAPTPKTIVVNKPAKQTTSKVSSTRKVTTTVSRHGDDGERESGGRDYEEHDD